MLTIEFYVKHHFYVFNAQSEISFSNEIRKKERKRKEKFAKKFTARTYLGTLDSL